MWQNFVVMKQSNLSNIICIIVAIVAMAVFFPGIVKFILGIVLFIVYIIMGFTTSVAVIESDSRDGLFRKHRNITVAICVMFWPLFYIIGLFIIAYKMLIEANIQNKDI